MLGSSIKYVQAYNTISVHSSSKNQNYHSEVVGNKAKGRMSKRVFQESKARQNFRKTNISYPLIRTRTKSPRSLLQLFQMLDAVDFIFPWSVGW